MKIKAVIIEDEIPARQTLKSYLKKYFPIVEVAYEIGTVQKAKEVLQEKSIDLLFLDVQLRDGLGLGLLDTIQKLKIRVVFTTAFDDFTQEAFKHKAFGYLLKPLDPEDFKEIMNRVIKDITYSDHTTTIIKVPFKSGFTLIDTNSIIRCEAHSNYTKMICDNNETYIVSKTLKLVENEYLKEDIFVRTHQSHLINVKFVNLKSIENNAVKMINGDQVPISRSRKDVLFDQLKKLT